MPDVRICPSSGHALLRWKWDNAFVIILQSASGGEIDAAMFLTGTPRADRISGLPSFGEALRLTARAMS